MTGVLLTGDDKVAPSPMQEVETLFHEFGHALQHMLTTVEYGLVSGIRGIEWDAVRARAPVNPSAKGKVNAGWKHMQTGKGD